VVHFKDVNLVYLAYIKFDEEVSKIMKKSTSEGRCGRKLKI